MSMREDDMLRKRDTGEPGNGGQFGTTQRAPSGLSLDRPPGVPPRPEWPLSDAEVAQAAAGDLAAAGPTWVDENTPPGTRVWGWEFAKDGTRRKVYGAATVLPHSRSVSVRFDGGGSHTNPISHKSWHLDRAVPGPGQVSAVTDVLSTAQRDYVQQVLATPSGTPGQTQGERVREALDELAPFEATRPISEEQDALRDADLEFKDSTGLAYDDEQAAWAIQRAFDGFPPNVSKALDASYGFTVATRAQVAAELEKHGKQIRPGLQRWLLDSRRIGAQVAEAVRAAG